MSNFKVQIGTVENFTTADYDWQTVEFSPAFPDGVIPQVFVQIQTFGGEDIPGLRLQNISNTGFQVSMREAYMSNTTSSVVGDLGIIQGNGHPNEETLAWMAVAIG
ncbi:MAG: hypothetical protein HEP71_07475 [Roseivirga sp.]|nr:hypothetical protein [Roseivirga sp.]